jgi:hypothetical protein
MFVTNECLADQKPEGNDEDDLLPCGCVWPVSSLFLTNMLNFLLHIALAITFVTNESLDLRSGACVWCPL